MPTVLVKWTVLHRSYGILPLIARGEVCTLDDTSARETEDARFHVVKGLRKILTHSVLATFPSINREEADVLKVGYDLAVAPYA